ncbi:hypothetical protein RFI_29668 [Reticulomyxa filosa]|uniref:Uncharacterized protein n=1 Tax=Reticulomyxa filosa TaxID=46433 RepID=X6M3W6_RETFI|nr:hypothetical protein RFI_29668 [Reticulomyxa filosa]|eukprot:ETO07720.1 hypothetical protein RFI_29668 [Reticulomyxa filosa]
MEDVRNSTIESEDDESENEGSYLTKRSSKRFRGNGWKKVFTLMLSLITVLGIYILPNDNPFHEKKSIWDSVHELVCTRQNWPCTLMYGVIESVVILVVMAFFYFIVFFKLYWRLRYHNNRISRQLRSLDPYMIAFPWLCATKFFFFIYVYTYTYIHMYTMLLFKRLVSPILKWHTITSLLILSINNVTYALYGTLDATMVEQLYQRKRMKILSKDGVFSEQMQLNLVSDWMRCLCFTVTWGVIDYALWSDQHNFGLGFLFEKGPHCTIASLHEEYVQCLRHSIGPHVAHIGDLSDLILSFVPPVPDQLIQLRNHLYLGLDYSYFDRFDFFKKIIT